ncbi:MAG: hypothetical protein JJE25_11385 [Bacteroidia bacterium]|nr:hypothetical protein [Bacteroidia bacterium]
MKSKLNQSILMTVAVLFVSATLQAQVNKPKMPDAVRDFVKFIGIWEANTTIMIDTIPHKVFYRMNFRRTADAYGMNVDEGYTDSTLGNLRAANLVGYNAADSKIHWFYADNLGAAYERIGKWTDSDNLRFEYSRNQNDKKYTEIITYAFYGNDEFTYTHTSYLDAKQLKKITGKFERKKADIPVRKQ